MDSFDNMHSRLKHARRRAGFKNATSAIEQFGWKGSTYRAHENGQNQFDPIAAKQYASAFGTSASWLLTGEESPQASLEALNPHLISEKKIYCTGRVAAGEWVEEKIRTALPRQESIFPPDHRFPIDAQFDLKVRGGSVNLFAQDGDYLRCVNLSPETIEFADSDLVIVKRTIPGGLTEITARKVSVCAGRVKVHFLSTDPLFQETVPIDGKSSLVIAKVLWKFRSF